MNKRLIAAKAEHEKYLKKMGVSKAQLASRKKNRIKEQFKLGYEGTAERYFEQKLPKDLTTGTDSQTGTDGSIMGNLHKEPDHVRKEILRKAKLVEASYNKGGLQYSPNEIRKYGVK